MTVSPEIEQKIVSNLNLACEIWGLSWSARPRFSKVGLITVPFDCWVCKSICSYGYTLENDLSQMYAICWDLEGCTDSLLSRAFQKAVKT